ncbi:DUF4832 domain-containing protein [Aquimarina aggregata]|uniref:DUF4832 domain-containing protein n=1 Tax=Aquimarina aggregata TaxID=1642818 RepID=UPI002493CE41|nr:DUF4832 domain-containing protein [Aquimarina aggregata]
MKKASVLLFLITIIFLKGCSNSDSTIAEDPDSDTIDQVRVTYFEDDSDFPNPDRGFYRYSETKASSYVVLNENKLKEYRAPSMSSGANYNSISTLIFRYYVLDEFVDKPISSDFLLKMEEDFIAARNAGVKLIPRFTYTITANSGPCPAGFICPPYGDASKDIILNHIAQIGPVITNNIDVINCLQMGLIGTWGENYYTDFFGDASNNDTQGKLIDKNWEDRIVILKALLDATPNDLMIQVRYPQMKQRYVYGISSPTSAEALVIEEAFTDNDKARIGFHNDCLFASADDFGTYTDYGNSSSSSVTDIDNLKKYFKEDSKYVIVGGETCNDGYSPQNDCTPIGIANTDLRELHYTFLNADYNNEVNNDWTDGGCIEEIKKNLGYRFVLKEALFPTKAILGNSFEISIDLENIGYASPVRDRNVILILKHKSSDDVLRFVFNTDVRKWFSSVNLKETFTLSDAAVPGDYDVFIHLADKYETISKRSEYSIRLANKDIWDASTGYNNLNYVLKVE